MRKLLILLMVIIMASSVLAECIDSDDGKNYYVKGTVTDPYGSNTDSCIKLTTGSVFSCSLENEDCRLAEYYCENGEHKEEWYKCSYGCEDGACIEVEEEQPLQICEESDDGYDIYFAGRTKGIYGSYKERKEFSDYCVTAFEGKLNQYVSEFYCEEGVVKEKIVKCEYECVAGACSKEQIDEEVPVVEEIEDEEEPTETEKIESAVEGEIVRTTEDEKKVPYGETEEITSCEDSDNGIDFSTSGYILITYADGTKKRLVDSCGYAGDKDICTDYFCGIAQGKPHYWMAKEKCKEGYFCQGGNCLKYTGEQSTLFYFYGDSCSHCVGMEEELKKVSQELEIDITKIDVKKDSSLLKKYKIRAVPTLVFIDERVDYAKEEGKRTAQQIIEWIKTLKSLSNQDLKEVIESVEEFPAEPELSLKEEIIEIPPEIEEEVTFLCNGCLIDKKCYPLGYRKSGDYCLDSEQFVNQLEAGKSCDNNFECKSNVCIDGECISGGFLKQILDWLKGLFGG